MAACMQHGACYRPPTLHRRHTQQGGAVPRFRRVLHLRARQQRQRRSRLQGLAFPHVQRDHSAGPTAALPSLPHCVLGAAAAVGSHRCGGAQQMGAQTATAPAALEAGEAVSWAARPCPCLRLRAASLLCTRCSTPTFTVRWLLLLLILLLLLGCVATSLSC